MVDFIPYNNQLPILKTLKASLAFKIEWHQTPKVKWLYQAYYTKYFHTEHEAWLNPLSCLWSLRYYIINNKRLYYSIEIWYGTSILFPCNSSHETKSDSYISSLFNDSKHNIIYTTNMDIGKNFFNPLFSVSFSLFFFS